MTSPSLYLGLAGACGAGVPGAVGDARGAGSFLFLLKAFSPYICRYISCIRLGASRARSISRAIAFNAALYAAGLSAGVSNSFARCLEASVVIDAPLFITAA